jgi:EmrB/QacA subfamily drug resistance transporter
VRAGEGSAGVVALACAAQFMVVLDVSVVNVALPSVQSALGAEPAHVQWIVHAYTLVFAGLLLLGGRLADLYGRKRVFLLGLALFAVASLVGGMASTPGLLIAARAAQGAGAALLAPATLTLITTTFPPGPRRTRAVATWTAVAVGGGAAGNLAGGLLTELLSWRWVLLVNVPIGVLAVLAAVRLLAADGRVGPRPRLDVPGAVSVTAGLTAITYGVTRATTHGWTDPVTVAAVAAGVLALVVFVVVETRHAPAPLMPLQLLRVRSVSAGNAVMLLAGACFNPMWFFLSFTMQDVLGYDALATGIGFLPHTLVTIVVGARLAPWLLERVEARPLVAVGAVIAAAGFLWQSRVTPDADYLSAMLGPAVLVAVGGGLLTTPLTTIACSGVPRSAAGAASGLVNTAKQVGGALGLALLVAVAGARADTPAALAASNGRAFTGIAAVLVIVAVGALALPREERS